LEQPGVFNLLAEPIQDFLEQQGLREPTLPQEKAIARAKNAIQVYSLNSCSTKTLCVHMLYSRIERKE